MAVDLNELIRREAVFPERNRVAQAFAPIHSLLNEHWNAGDKVKLRIGSFGELVPLIQEGDDVFLTFRIDTVLREIEHQITPGFVERAQDQAVRKFYDTVQSLH